MRYSSNCKSLCHKKMLFWTCLYQNKLLCLQKYDSENEKKTGSFWTFAAWALKVS